MRRPMLMLTAALAAATLTGCATGEPTFPGGQTSAPAASAPGGTATDGSGGDAEGGATGDADDGATDGSGEGATDGSDDDATAAPEAPEGGFGDAGALDCEEPPAPPAEPLAYGQWDLPTPKSGDPATLTATMETTCGDIVVELAAAAAPQTVASFEFLAREGYWEDSPCHRLTTSGIFVLQCGDPTGTGRGGPGYGYGIENAPPDGLYPPGTLAMARTADPESNGSQFFIVWDDTQLPTEGGGYSIFGRVTQGLDIVQNIAAAGGEAGAADAAPAQPISILSVEVTQ